MPRSVLNVGLTFFIILAKVLVVSAKTFVFTGVFWAKGNFNIPGVPTDTDNVVINNTLCIINTGVNAKCQNLTLTNDEVFIQKNASLTVHGQLFIRPTSKVTGVIIGENALLRTQKDVHFESFTVPERALIHISGNQSQYEYSGTFKFSPMGSIWGDPGSKIIATGNGNRSLPSKHCHYHDIVIRAANQISLSGSLGSGNGYQQFDGSLTIEQGTFSTNTHTVTGTPGESLIVKSGATYISSDTKRIPTEFSTLTFEPGSTVGFHRIGNQTLTPLHYWNVSIDGTGIKTLSDTTRVQGSITIRSGVLDMNNLLVLVSDEKGTGSMGFTCQNCNVRDSLFSQRYLPAEVDSTYLLMSSWMPNATVGSVGAEMTLKGFSGSTAPSSPVSTFSYYSRDTLLQTSSPWYKPQSPKDAIDPFIGVLVFPELSQSITTTLFGANLQGDQGYTFFNANPGEWYLIGNPYPSAVKIDLPYLNSLGIGNPTTLDREGNFLPLDNGDTLHLGEAMMVQTLQPQPSLIFREKDKVGSPGQNGISKSGHRQFGKGLELAFTLVREDGSMDHTFIKGADTSYTLAYDEGRDFLKLPHLQGKSMIYTQHGQEKMALNKIPATLPPTTVIPIHVEKPSPTVGLTRNYQLAITNTASFLQRNLCAVLVNKTNGNLISLEKDTVVPFSVADTFTGAAFELRLSNPLNTRAHDVTCLNDSNGAAFSIGQGAPLNFFWFNALGDTIQKSLNTFGSDSLSGLAPGSYRVLVQGNPQCNVIGDRFFIEEPPTEVEALFSVSKNTVDLADTGLVNFQNLSQGAAQFEWWVWPDSIFSTDTNAFLVFEQQGKREIALVAQYNACRDTAFTNLTIIHSFVPNLEHDLCLTYRVTKEEVEMLPTWSEQITLSLVSAEGKRIFSGSHQLQANEWSTIELPPISAGIYFLSFYSQHHQKVLTKKLFFQ